MKSFRTPIWLAGFVTVCLATMLTAQTSTPGFSTGQAARLLIGQTNFTTADYGATNQLLGSPSGIAYANGVLWVADSNRLGATPNNNRVLRYSDAGTYPTPTQDPTIPGSTCGVCRGKASLVLGQPDFITSNSPLPPTPTGMRSPTGVATDGKILAVSDTDNNRVLIWLTLPTGNGQPPDVVIGQADFKSNRTSVPPTATSLRGPTGLWLADGKLYVADTQDNRILIYNKIPAKGTFNVAADVVVGQVSFTAFVQPDLTQTNGTPTATNMQDPVSVTTDGQRMFVTDLGQNRVLIYNRIPTSNGAAADLALGQPDLVSAFDNNSSSTSGLCASNGVDSNKVATYPARCAATLSFPRQAISDGTRLFVADGGNDRILVYNKIPTVSGAPADVILGEPDEFTDNTGQNPDGTDAFQTPTSMAWDATNGNLYVSDTYNRRVVVYSPGLPNIPLAGARNAASLEIYALGSVTIGGGVKDKDTVTVTIGKPDAAGNANTVDYTYTVVATDTLTSIATNLAKVVNKAPDPNVVATVNTSTNTIILTARKPGGDGANITVATSASASAQVAATASAANLSIYLKNPTQIAPGTLLQITGVNLCDNTASGDLTQTYLPFSLAGCELFVDGNRTPLLYVSPTQINAQLPWEYADRTSVSLYARSIHADGTITTTSPIAVTVVPQNPGIFALAGTDPRPGIVFHGFSSANDVLSIDGTINKGDVATINIGDQVYTYTVQSTDTLASVRDAFISLINASDPNVTASAASSYQRILLVANTPGPDGEGLAVSQSVTGTNASLVITVFNPTLCCDNTAGALVTSDNPAVPGEILYVYATGLGPGDPNNFDTGKVTPPGLVYSPVVPVDSILTGGSAANVVNVNLVPGTVGVYSVQFQLNSGLGADAATQLTIAQQTFVSNVVTFPVQPPGTAIIGGAPQPASRNRRR